MKVFEVIHPKDASVFLVHGEADVRPALMWSLFRDDIVVSFEAQQGLSQEQLDSDFHAITAMFKRVTRFRANWMGSQLIYSSVDSSKQIKKVLDWATEYFRPGPWRWVVSVSDESSTNPTNEDIFGDAARARKARGAEDLKSHGIWLISVNKDGSESRMVTAKKHFRSAEEAIEHHNLLVKNNPHRTITHNLHMDNELGKYKLTLSGHHKRKTS